MRKLIALTAVVASAFLGLAVASEAASADNTWHGGTDGWEITGHGGTDGWEITVDPNDWAAGTDAWSW